MVHDACGTGCMSDKRTFLHFTGMAGIVETGSISTLDNETVCGNEVKETKREEEFWELFPYDTHRVVMKFIEKSPFCHPGPDMIAYITAFQNTRTIGNLVELLKLKRLVGLYDSWTWPVLCLKREHLYIDDIVAAISKAPIYRLDFYNQTFDNRDWDVLQDILSLPRVKYAGIYQWGVGDEGVQRLSSFLGQTNIRVLNLEYNFIGDEGVVALSQVLEETKITKLRLGVNEVGIRIWLRS